MNNPGMSRDPMDRGSISRRGTPPCVMIAVERGSAPVHLSSAPLIDRATTARVFLGNGVLPFPSMPHTRISSSAIRLGRNFEICVRISSAFPQASVS